MMPRIAIILVCFLALPSRADHPQREKRIDRVLQMDRLITVHIRMSGEQWKMMQPQKASRLAVALGVLQHPTTQQTLDAAARKTTEEEDSPIEGARRLAGLTGNEYAYVRASVDIEGKSISNVGVRFKGQYSYTLAGTSPRRPMKLKFDHFVEDQRFEGIECLGLNTNALDPSHLRETLGHALFREAGVPAPRTCFALVYLSVDGVYDKDLLGVFTGLEEIDKDFLRRKFGTAKGLLIRPERTRNLAYLGEKWEEYSRYNIQTDATPFTAKRFMDFTRLIHQASDEEFASSIQSYVDVDEFLRFVAANVLMVNLDSFLVNGHNFYIYIHPQTGRISFVPWDLHLGFGWHGKTIDDWTALTIDKPYRDSNRLLERVLNVSSLRDVYRQYLCEFATGCFSPEKMHTRIERLEQVVRQVEEIARQQGKVAPVSMPAGTPQPRADLKEFVTWRAKSVLDQLDGKVEGLPVGGRPTPKRRPQPEPPKPAPQKKVTPPAKPIVPPKVVAPRPRVLPPHPLIALLSRTIDADRDNQFSRDEMQAAARHLFIAHAWAHKGAMTEDSLAETFDRLQTILNPYPVAVEGKAAELDPQGTRPGLIWAKALLGEADGNKLPTRGQPMLETLIGLTEKLFDSADTDRNGQLTSAELTTLLDKLVPRP